MSGTPQKKGRVLDTDDELRALLTTVRRIAILGIKTEEHRDQPAFAVPEYLVGAGFEIVPVPVYYPDVQIILGAKVYRTLVEIPGELDLVDLFRRAADLTRHLDDLLAKKPRAVWMQSGIRHEEVTRALTEQGIDVVQNRCLMVEHRRLIGPSADD